MTDVADPLPVSSVDAPGAGMAACTSLLAALPDPLGGLPRRQLVQGDDPLLAGVAAWGEPAVILRCGVPTPQELTCSSPVQVVDGVAWLPIPGSGGITYLAVDRPVRVALTVPDGTSTGPWQELSKIIGGTLTERPTRSTHGGEGAGGPRQRSVVLRQQGECLVVGQRPDRRGRPVSAGRCPVPARSGSAR